MARGKARTMQIVDEIVEGVPIMGSVAAGGLIETYSDVQENLDISNVLEEKCFALTVNGIHDRCMYCRWRYGFDGAYYNSCS